jgi:indolepyruvate ferredoxin oxidoreductase
LRGTVLDPFGKTLERRMERALADDYEQTMRRAFAIASASSAPDVARLAGLHARVRGYGHVKLANLAAAKRTEREIAAALAIVAATSPAVQQALDETRGARTLRGIPVVVAGK